LLIYSSFFSFSLSSLSFFFYFLFFYFREQLRKSSESGR